jgi:hypothetical protein
MVLVERRLDIALATAVPLAVKFYGPICKSYNPMYRSNSSVRLARQSRAQKSFWEQKTNDRATSGEHDDERGRLRIRRKNTSDPQERQQRNESNAGGVVLLLLSR